MVNRSLGSEGMADWAIGTRLVMFVWQIVCRVPNSSEPVFWEMFSRQEFLRLRSRLLELTRLSCSIAVFLGGAVIAINSSFIHVWTAGRAHWTWNADVCLAVWLIISTANASLNMIPGIVKQVGAMKYVFLSEGLVLIALACYSFPFINSPAGVALVILLAIFLFRLPYGIYRAKEDMGIAPGNILTVIAKVLLLLLLLILGTVAIHVLTRGLSPTMQLISNLLLYTLVGVPITFFLGLSSEVKEKLLKFGLRIKNRII